MNNDNITPNETLKLHEIAMAKVLCATKSSTMQSLVQDEELKKMLKQDVEATKEQLKEIRELLQKSSMLEDGSF